MIGYIVIYYIISTLVFIGFILRSKDFTFSDFILSIAVGWCIVPIFIFVLIGKILNYMNEYYG